MCYKLSATANLSVQSAHSSQRTYHRVHLTTKLRSNGCKKSDETSDDITAWLSHPVMAFDVYSQLTGLPPCDADKPIGQGSVTGLAYY